MSNLITTQWYGEFAYELIQCIPYAYWAYKNNLLEKTESYKDTKCLYYFSPNHLEVEDICLREGNNRNFPVNNTFVMSDMSQWIPPPYKEQYKNNVFIYDKPIMIINNKYNSEWRGPPLNYINVASLKKIIEYLSDKYQIIYFRVKKDMLEQTTVWCDLNEERFIRSNFPNVLFLHDLAKKYNYSINETQLMIYSNASGFITTAGGNETLCSYFGGNVVVYMKYGEHLPWHKHFANANHFHADNYDDFVSLVKNTF